MTTKAKAPTKTKASFNATTTALHVRQGTQKLRDLPPDQQTLVRRELAHTGRLRTKLLRGGEAVTEKSAPLAPVRSGHFLS